MHSWFDEVPGRLSELPKDIYGPEHLILKKLSK
jgi:hypothetical protein